MVKLMDKFKRGTDSLKWPICTQSTKDSNPDAVPGEHQQKYLELL